jgi:NADH-quinone oxidoreductase subunit N
MNVLAFAAATHVKGPHIDWAAFSPIIGLTAGGLLVLMVGLLRPEFIRTRLVPLLTIGVFGATIGLSIWRFGHSTSIISGALRVDHLALELTMLFAGAGIAAVLLSMRAISPRESGHGEYHALLVFSTLGMAVFVAAQNLISLFIGLELLSIPLYILCASETRRESSLESGLKYLIIGSVGSATLVYGFALVYGATGSTDFSGIAHAMTRGVLGDPMLFTGLALAVVGFAFKASIAPFHQWTPDVYEGAPTPVTAFMATATKAAALGAIIRFFDGAALHASSTWAPALAAIAAITIIVGNVGALGQTSLKRMLGYSGVAQAGYMLAGVVVATRLGVQATVLYLFAYTGMNFAAFAVIVANEHDRADGDDVAALAGLGARRPLLAWPMTVGMLALAGIPGTVGFIGKFQLIHALVAGGYTWLGIVLVIGSMISLGYYLRVVASMWMRPGASFPGARLRPAGGGVGAVPAGAGGGGGRPLPRIAGGSQEADVPGAGGSEGERGQAASGAADGSGGARGASGARGTGAGAQGRNEAHEVGARGQVAGPTAPAAEARAAFEPEVAFVAVVAAAAAIFFGIFPQPLFSFAVHAGTVLSGLL